MEPLTTSTVLTFGGIILLLQVANMAVNIFAKLRRSPPIDQTLQNYVRRDEFDKLRDELRRADAKLFDLARENTDRIAALQTADASWKNGISMQMGRFDASINELLKRVKSE